MSRILEEYDFDYLVKTDDDVVVNVPNLITTLIPLKRTSKCTSLTIIIFNFSYRCKKSSYKFKFK